MMKNIKRKAHQLSFIFLPLLALSFGMVSCGSDSNSERRGSRGEVQGQPDLLSYNDCYELVRNGDGSLQFDFSSAIGSHESWRTYVSNGYNSDGSEREEKTDDGTIVVYYGNPENFSGEIVSGYIDIPDNVMSIIMRDLGEDINEEELCVHGLDFNRDGIYLVAKDRQSFNGINNIRITD